MEFSQGHAEISLNNIYNIHVSSLIRSVVLKVANSSELVGVNRHSMHEKLVWLTAVRLNTRKIKFEHGLQSILSFLLS